MSIDCSKIPIEIIEDINIYIGKLEDAGYQLVGGHYDTEHFGNYIARFANASVSIQVIRDRGQYRVDGLRWQLEPAGLWRTFNDRVEFYQTLLRFIASENS